MSRVIKGARTLPAFDKGRWPDLPGALAPTRAEKPPTVDLDGARREADAIRRQARDEGYRDGYAAGQRQGREEGLAQAEAARREAASLMDEVETARAGLNDQLQEERARLLEEARSDIVDLVMAAARQVLQRELTARPDEVESLVRSLLGQIRGQEAVTILVNPADAELLESRREELLAGFVPPHRVEIVADPQIEQGGAVVESPGGSWDARLSTRLEAVDDALRQVLGGRGEDVSS